MQLRPIIGHKRPVIENLVIYELATYRKNRWYLNVTDSFLQNFLENFEKIWKILKFYFVFHRILAIGYWNRLFQMSKMQKWIKIPT